jgi:hypothetical protein
MKRNQVRIEELKKLIKEWDTLSKTNTSDNIHNLSTSERQDWVDELMELTTDIED